MMEVDDSRLRWSKTFTYPESEFLYEEERLFTFIDWPVSFISPEELAKEGFIYLRNEDYCACVFCKIIIGHWVVGDTPKGEHLDKSPHCRFAKGEEGENIPIGGRDRVSTGFSANEGSNAPTSGIDVCGLGRRDTTGSSPEYYDGLKNLSTSSFKKISMTSFGLRPYMAARAKEFARRETRLQSFWGWPNRVKQTPEKLAEAGFYYYNTLSDHVKCFCCGLGLRNWEANDDPWDEHAKWSPECQFISFSKGTKLSDEPQKEVVASRVPRREGSLSNAAAAAIAKEAAGIAAAVTVAAEAIVAEAEAETEAAGAAVASSSPSSSWLMQSSSSLSPSLESHSQNDNEPEGLEERAVTRHTSLSGHESEIFKKASGQMRRADRILDHCFNTIFIVQQYLENKIGPSTTVARSNQVTLNNPSVNTTMTGAESTNRNENSNDFSVSITTDEAERETNEGRISPRTLNEPSTSSIIADDNTSNDQNTIENSASIPARRNNLSNVNGLSQSITEEATPVSISSTETRSFEKESLCTVCIDKKTEIVFLPCTHMVTCCCCTLALELCPICRSVIKYAFKPIIS